MSRIVDVIRQISKLEDELTDLCRVAAGPWECRRTPGLPDDWSRCCIEDGGELLLDCILVVVWRRLDERDVLIEPPCWEGQHFPEYGKPPLFAMVEGQTAEDVRRQVDALLRLAGWSLLEGGDVNKDGEIE